MATRRFVSNTLTAGVSRQSGPSDGACDTAVLLTLMQKRARFSLFILHTMSPLSAKIVGTGMDLSCTAKGSAPPLAPVLLFAVKRALQSTANRPFRQYLALSEINVGF
ncbi:uncharacterized protein UDID_17274 [Ustilago sp. UG-2017a]|nr:uncharacterized protein UDID_17274 [Ustilago sp. UG-2017a]